MGDGNKKERKKETMGPSNLILASLSSFECHTPEY